MKKHAEQTIDFVKEAFKDDSSGHDWWHTYHVWQMAKKISATEGGDLFVIELAALLHDIDDFKFNESGSHKTVDWLEKINIDKNTANQILEIIETVSFKGAGVDTRPKTIEGKIVQDADRLDTIGAIGIARTFACGGSKHRSIYDPKHKFTFHKTFKEYKKSKGSSLNHFYEKLLLISETLNTKTAKNCAAHRHKILVKYLDEFLLEWDGKDIKNSD